jgi:hypothetical protein
VPSVAVVASDSVGEGASFTRGEAMALETLRISDTTEDMMDMGRRPERVPPPPPPSEVLLARALRTSSARRMEGSSALMLGGSRAVTEWCAIIRAGEEMAPRRRCRVLSTADWGSEEEEAKAAVDDADEEKDVTTVLGKSPKLLGIL